MAADVPVAELDARFSGPERPDRLGGGTPAHRRAGGVFGSQRCVPMVDRTSPRCWPCGTPPQRTFARVRKSGRHPRARGLVSATRSVRVRCCSFGSRPQPSSASLRASSSARRDGALVDRATWDRPRTCARRNWGSGCQSTRAEVVRSMWRTAAGHRASVDASYRRQLVIAVENRIVRFIHASNRQER